MIAFLANHVSGIAVIDLFTVPTATVRVLFVFEVLSHAHRRIVDVDVTAHPTVAWTAQQLCEAFPWDSVVTRVPPVSAGAAGIRYPDQRIHARRLFARQSPWSWPRGWRLG